MIELRNREQLASAIERARRDAKSLVVRPMGASRHYRVTNREKGTEYTVEFFVRGSRRFGRCSCTAGANNLACKHLAAAAALNSYLAAQGLLDHRQQRAAA
jgi:uncharacterized Zn finger protein